MNQPQDSAAPPMPAKAGIAKKWLVAILVLTFAFVLMPFLLWYMTTFTRPLTDQDIASSFTDVRHPRRAQHALSQLADRIASPDPAYRASARRWYPEILRLAAQGSPELRVTAAWVMGQDNQAGEFHAALLKQLADGNPMVRRNAALSLVRFGDTAGHDVIAAMLEPYPMTAPRSGQLKIRLRPGDVIHPGTLVGRILVPGGEIELRSEVPGTIRQWLPADGSAIESGQPMLLIDPGAEMVWEALRALYVIGSEADLQAVRRYTGVVEGIPPQVQQQAELCEKAILARSER